MSEIDSTRSGVAAPTAASDRSESTAGFGMLRATLDELMRAVEALSPVKLLGSILLLDADRQHLRHGAAPSLPDAYNAAIDGIAIGPTVGSCGTAAFRAEPVYVEDIAADPLWADFRELALGHGLRACWSTPIISSRGELLGTFAMYYREPRAPTRSDLDLVTFVTRSAALAIERDRAETALRALNQELEMRVAARSADLDRTWRLSQDLLVIAAEDGTLLTVNTAWTSLLDWSPEELVGANFAAFTHPDDLEATRAAFGRLLETPLVEPFEYRLRHRDGSFRWFAWTGAADADRVYASGRHTTHEHEQASALAQAQDSLRQSQKLEAIGQLTGGVAHDFNNLLTVIKGSVELLRRPSLSDEKRERYVQAIGETADRAAKLTGQLLAFARRQALKPELFDIGSSIADVLSMIGTLTGSRIVVESHVPVEPVYVLVDRSQLDTAIVNMAVNARDAMAGEGRLTISTGAVGGMPAIRAHDAVAGDFVAVAVTDTGAGMPSEQLEKIFEPFFTTKTVGEGTGLGLSQVLGFAKQSGGDIRVESRVGEGTTFTLYLPRAFPDADATVGIPLAEPASVGGVGICVLVVEDNEDVGAFAAAALGELGYDSRLVPDAEQALALLADTPDRFHIVFSDVVMPGMGGIELGGRVRESYPAVPVILTSGYSHVLAQNGKHGFELLHKPYSIEQLSRVLHKAASWAATKARAAEQAPTEARLLVKD